MIPKVIHYCWFGGGPMNPLHQRCVETWKRYCPDYEIKLWDEKNSDLDNDYCREAIRQRKWAFVSDWVRFDVLSKHGGIYLDTDIELIRSLDDIAGMSGCVFAREAIDSIGTAFIASEAGSPVLQSAREIMLKDLPDLRLFTTSPIVAGHAIGRNPAHLTTVLPNPTFFPFNPYDKGNPRNARQFMYSDVTDATIGIHHFGLNGSWHNKRFTRAIFRITTALGLRRRWDISFSPFRNNPA